MEELLSMVRDHDVAVAKVLDLVEHQGWSRKWIWERLQALDDQVIEVLARLSQSQETRRSPAEAATEWLRSLRSKKLAPPGSGPEVEDTLEFKLCVVFRMHQWLWVRQTCLDLALDGTLIDRPSEPGEVETVREAYQTMLETGRFEYDSGRGYHNAHDSSCDEEAIATRYFGREETRRMYQEEDWLGDHVCEESLQRLRERYGYKRT